jgi:primosomal protein N' (replication factor Y)
MADNMDRIEKNIFYEVAVAAPLFNSLTYEQPVEHPRRLLSGVRVLVPLGNRLVTGFVMGETDPSLLDNRNNSSGSNSNKKSRKIVIRPIIDVLDEQPLFPKNLIPLFRWLSDYYHHPLGEVIRTAMPGGMNVGSGRVVRLTLKGRNKVDFLKNDLGDDSINRKNGKKPDQKRWFEGLLENNELGVKETASIWRKVQIQRKLKKWERMGLVVLEQVLCREKVRPKTELVISPPAGLEKNFLKGGDNKLDYLLLALDKNDRENIGKAEKTLLQHYLRLYCNRRGQAVPRRELAKLYSSTTSVLKRLVEKNILTVKKSRVYRNPFGESLKFIKPVAILNTEQEQVLSVLHPAVEKQQFNPFLLFGVTGCGKTEVYLRATAKTLTMGQTVLVMVPEIALASQIEAHFYSRFKEQLAVFHSGLSDGERLDSWQRIRDGAVKVVVGTRSAVFAPLVNLGLIIVDEEHEPSYKQDDGLCYNGRDVAVLRAKQIGCPVILGSATPSVISYSHAKSGKYTLLTMKNRVGGGRMPKVTVVALNKSKRTRPDLFFSDILIKALEDNLKKNQQSLLFVNRRGYASFLLCRDCGFVIQCQHCKVSMTLHRMVNQLVCHYCGYTLNPDIICPSCNSGKIAPLGLGAERIEREVSQLMPEARVARLDSDTVKTRKQYLTILKAVRERRVDILVGTQMIAKGLHFPSVTLVGVVWADSGLGMPDYKASERTFSLLSQVTGRAGRGEFAGRVIVQTHQPDHYAVCYARDHDYTGFYEQEILNRQELSYPPFSRLVNIRLGGRQEAAVREAATKTGEYLRLQVAGKKIPVEILGPAPSPLAMLRDHYRYQILLKSGATGSLQQLCRLLLSEKSRICPTTVQLHIDIDPENMM